MIINNLDTVKNTKSQQPQRAQMTAPRVIITPKEVNMKDFLFHYPIFKSDVSFGADKSRFNRNPYHRTDSSDLDFDIPLFIDYIGGAPTSGQVSTKTQKPPKATTFDDSLTKYTPPGLKLDRGQKDAMASLYLGDTTILTAPTGTGKTLVADYIIKKNLSEGKDSIYTTPTKALANEKYKDACEKFGKENVGLLTGDIKVNKHAPVQIMTAEIYLNKLLGGPMPQITNNQELEAHLANPKPLKVSQSFKTEFANLATVIHDENHTMNDPERGIVYEMSIINTPPHVQQLALSATVGNDKKVEGWFNRLLTENKPISSANSVQEARLIHVDPSERHVPLKFFIFDKESKSIVPLMIEKYNLSKIKQAAAPDSKEPLSDKQKEVLEEISKKADGDGTVGHGVETLTSVLKNHNEAELETMEEALVKHLGFDELEAKRSAALLSDKTQRKFNPALVKDPEATTKAKKAKKPLQASATKKVISPTKLQSLFESKSMPMDMTLALYQLGNGVSKSGLTRVIELSKRFGGKDMNPDAFKKLLVNKGVKSNDAATITKHLTTQDFAPKASSPVMDLIAALDKENKTPMMCVQFSKKGCDKLREEFLESGQSLLSEEEQQSVKGILKKYEAQGVFLGSKEDADGFLSGSAVHHSGKMPGNKALVEELAAAKLAKVTFSTDTLGVGINFPVRTVAFTQLSKYAGVDETGKADFRTITANEFHQIAGRAGRRGKDAIGNVILMPDKEHSAAEIFNLVTAPSDDLKSNFRPVYKNVTSLVGATQTTANIESIVDKSFLRESLDPTEVNPDEVVSEVKSQFHKMAKVVARPELGCFTGSEGNLVPTLKGSLVAKARGVNELLFAQMMTEAPLEQLTPPQLAAVACSLTQGNEKNKTLPATIDDATSEFLENIEVMNQKITTAEAAEGMASKEFVPNRYAAQFVQKWASAPLENPQEAWGQIVKHDMKKATYFDEGDLFKSVNRTVDVVQQIGDVAEYIITNPGNHPEAKGLSEKMKIVSETAKKALESLKKSPMAELPFVDEVKHLKK